MGGNFCAPIHGTMCGRYANCAVLVAVLLLVLLVVSALVVAYASGWASVRSHENLGNEFVGGWVADTVPATVGAYPSETQTEEVVDAYSGGTFTGALLRHHTNALMDSVSTRTHPDDMVNPRVGADHTGGSEGGRVPSKSKRRWTEFESWEELREDRTAHGAYVEDVTNAVNNIPADWSALRAASAEMLKDDREWAGLINLVNGVPTIVEKVASPIKVGDSASLRIMGEVPLEVINMLTRKPAYYFFHTHPDTVKTPQLVSPEDVIVAAHESFMGRYAANLMVSTPLIAMYGMYKEPLDRIYSAPHPYLEFSQYSLDLYAALVGMRSRKERYTISDFANTLREFGMFYIELPTDAYANKYYNTVYSAPRSITDVSTYDMHLRAVELAQAEAYPEARRDDARAAA